MTTTEMQVRHRGFAVWTKPGINMVADHRARMTSQLEWYFLKHAVGPRLSVTYRPGDVQIIGGGPGDHAMAVCTAGVLW